MVNFITEKSQRILTLRYYQRLFAVSAFLLGSAALSGAAFLLPSYFLARLQADQAANFLDASQKAVNAGSAGGAPGILAVFSERVAIMKTYVRDPVTSRILSTMTVEPTNGVSLNKIEITPSEGGKGTVSLSGIAATRESLLAFVQKLQNKNIFSGVSLPVSDLASGSQIPFSLSFSYSLAAL
jgi:hypothetical protein